MNDRDKENLVNVVYASNLLMQNLTSLLNSSNPFLSDITSDILEDVTKIDQRLQRLLLISNTETKE